MKQLFIIAFVVLLFGACKKKADNMPEDNFDCVRNGGTLKGKAAMEFQIVGIWKLKKVSAMIPNPPVPNVSITFTSASQVQIAKDDKLLYKGPFEWQEIDSLTETFQILNIKSWDYQTLGDNYIRGAIRMCNTQLLIDDGMAADGPGYFFVKIGNI